MPAYKDLETIKKKIKKIGNEEELLKNSKSPYNDTPIPPKINEKNISSDDQIKQDAPIPPEGFSFDLDNVIDSIQDDKQEEEIHLPLDTLENFDIDGSLDNIQDISDKEILASDVKEEPVAIIEDQQKDSFDLGESLSDVSENHQDLNLSLDTDETEEKIGDEVPGNIESQEDINALLGGFETDTETNISESGNNLDSVLSGLGESGTEETSTGEFADLDSLLGDIPSTKDENQTSTEDIFKDLPSEDTADFSMSSVDDGLKDLAGQFDQETPGMKEESPDISQISGADLGGLDDLSSLLGEKKPEEEMPAEDVSGLSFEGMEEGIKDDTADLSGFDQVSLSDDTKGAEVIGEKEPSLDLGIEGLDELSMPAKQGGDEELSIQDFSSLEEKPNESMLDLESLSLDKLSEMGEDFAPSQIEGTGGEEEFKISEIKMPEGIDKVPQELSREDISSDKDIEINLTDDERKQIIISLTSLPKDAELKISKAIISNKYSNRQLKPLINALINNDSPRVILKLYEKITGDKGLERISVAKHTGLEFEEKQKSLPYLLKKNLMPIVAAISVGLTLVLAGLMLYGFVLKPTFEASSYYRLGKQKIKEKVFWEAEDNFKNAFEIQPRYKEVIEYARLYKKYKRYLEAEKKYNLAESMKPMDDNLALEFADFYRIKGDYERSEKKYKDLLKLNGKNISAMLGLAKNYFDWSDSDLTKLDDAWQVYLDVLEIDKKNKEAVYGKLYIALKQKKHKEVMKHYDYIEKVFGKKIDPYAYAELAGYLINMNELDNVKRILDKANRSRKNNQIIPEIDYQYARYNKLLNIRDIERKYLERALKQFVALKDIDPEEYNSVKNQKLLSNIFNDLGENYDLKEKASIKAEEYYNLAIKADPDNGKPYFNLANFSLKNKPNGYEEAKKLYLDAEQKGFKNDRLNYNLGWIYYREKNYVDSMQRIVALLDIYKDNSNLKFMIGTIYYNLGNYDLAESWLLEAYLHFADLAQQYYPLEIEVEEDKMIMDMIKKLANNLGATYQKKYERTRKTKYLIEATKYYSDSIMYLNRIATAMDFSDASRLKDLSNINLRMVLYPYAGEETPFIYEDFPLNFETTM
jgi:tetratricopeptide (TPR) repeat protein